MYIFLQFLPTVSELLSNVRLREVNQGGIVSIVTRLWAEQSRVQILAGARGFFHLWNVQTSSRAHPASLSISTRDPFQEYEQHGHETDHSAPYSAECMSGAIPLHSLYTLWCAEEQLHFLNRPILKRQLTINQLSCQIWTNQPHSNVKDHTCIYQEEKVYLLTFEAQMSWE